MAPLIFLHSVKFLGLFQGKRGPLATHRRAGRSRQSRQGHLLSKNILQAGRGGKAGLPHAAFRLLLSPQRRLALRTRLLPRRMPKYILYRRKKVWFHLLLSRVRLTLPHFTNRVGWNLIYYTALYLYQGRRLIPWVPKVRLLSSQPPSPPLLP